MLDIIFYERGIYFFGIAGVVYHVLVLVSKVFRLILSCLTTIDITAQDATRPLRPLKIFVLDKRSRDVHCKFPICSLLLDNVDAVAYEVELSS